MNFKKDCLYIPLAPAETEDPKGPNINPNWRGPTVKTWSAKGKGLYTWGERKKTDWDRWGIVNIQGEKRLLIVDFDLYKMEESRKKKIIKSVNDMEEKTRVHKSQRGGFHLFYLVEPKHLDVYFNDDNELKEELPVNLGEDIDDKLNGYVVDPDCENYEIYTDKYPIPINPKTDFPNRWLNGEKQEIKIESSELDEKELNERLKTAKEKDKKFKKLYNGEYESVGYDDRSGAEAALSAKIGFWFGRNRETIKKVMEKSAAQKWHEREDRSYRDSIVSVGLQGDEEYKPGKKDLSKTEKKEIKKYATDPNKLSWDKKTKFITFTCNFEIDDFEIEWGDTYELPKNLANCLLEKKKAAEGIWKCTECGKNYYQKEKPHTCVNEEEDEHKKTYKIRALHPSKPNQIGDVLLKNYRFATPAETITETKPGAVHIYKNGIYNNEGTMAEIRGLVKKINRSSTQKEQKKVIDHITTIEYYLENKFGLTGEEIVVKDGILDLEKLKVSPHDADKLALSKIPVEYEPDAECPKFKKFLKETFPSQKNRELIQEIIGTGLMNEKHHKKGNMMPGPTDAGKSTFLKIIKHVFGKDSAASETPKAIADSKWSRAQLRGKLLNISDETSSGKIYRTDRLKKILAGEEVSAEEKYSAIYTFEPTCEHLYGTNMTPSAERGDQAFWNRWIVTPTREDSVPDEEQDPELADKILEEEKSGILNWIIEGYKRYQENNGFSHKIDWTEMRDKWLNYGNSIQRFIQKAISHDEENKISSSDLYDIYVKFVDTNDNLSQESQKRLTEEIKKLSYVSYSNKYRFDGKQKSGFKHLSIDKEVLGTLGVDKSTCALQSEKSDLSERKEDVDKPTPKRPKVLKILKNNKNEWFDTEELVEKTNNSKEEAEEILEKLYSEDKLVKKGIRKNGEKLWVWGVPGGD